MIDWSLVVAAEQQHDTDRQAVRDLIAVRRHEAMCAGITIEGMSVATDDISQTRFAGAAVSAMLDPAYAVRWKTADGSFRLLSGDEIIAIATAVRAHVQACFDREAELLAQAEAGVAIDISFEALQIANLDAIGNNVRRIGFAAQDAQVAELGPVDEDPHTDEGDPLHDALDALSRAQEDDRRAQKDLAQKIDEIGAAFDKAEENAQKFRTENAEKSSARDAEIYERLKAAGSHAAEEVSQVRKEIEALSKAGEAERRAIDDLSTKLRDLGERHEKAAAETTRLRASLDELTTARASARRARLQSE